tara:strand:+ start:2941 stop:4161 length:1221 start_codon:yes stop_codon:yes gene_type:complete
MFRGGRVSSYGTGIASGLTDNKPGYKEGGQIGGGAIYGKPMGDRYGFAEPKLDTNIILQQVITDLGPNAEQSDIIEEYQKRIQTNEPSSEGGILDSFRDQFGIPVKSYPQIPQILYDTLNPSEETITERLQKSNPPDFGPGSKEPIIKTTDFQKRKKEYEEAELNKQIQIEKNKIKKTEELEKEKTLNNKIENLYAQKSDTDVMKDYMDMFSEAYGTDKEALNRSRYLELAKFGANILAQPGGQSIGEVLGQAGGPALEGMTKIEEAENQGQRQLKGVAMQAALKKMDNPYLDQLKLKSQITGKSMAEIINAETTPAGQGRVDELKLQQLAVDLSSVLTSKDVDFDSKAMAEILTKNKLKTSDVLKHTNPKDPGAELIVDQIYIFTKPTNGQYVGTWNGTGFDIID